jgi:hypothetical protein
MHKEDTMASKGYPADILAQTTEILAACQQIDPELRAGALTQRGLAEALADARDHQSQIAALEMQLTDLRNKRDEQLTQMWDAIKRVRATVKGVYGDNSSQYELVGGTRLQERKRPTRRQAA